jgi:hypothetical protein
VLGFKRRLGKEVEEENQLCFSVMDQMALLLRDSDLVRKVEI